MTDKRLWGCVFAVTCFWLSYANNDGDEKSSRLTTLDGVNETLDSVQQTGPFNRVKSNPVDGSHRNRVLSQDDRDDDRDDNLSLPPASIKPESSSATARRTHLSTASPIPSHVLQDARQDVAWFEQSHSYAMRASADYRFQVRLSPPSARGSPWPMPQVYQPTNISFPVASASAFEFHSVGEQCQLLDDAFRRFRRNVFDEDGGEASDNWHHENGEAVIHSVNVTVLKECIEYPYLQMDESYDLEVKRTGVSIITREVWGALRGLETLSQLIYHSDDGQMWVNKTYIHDFPRFPHRGILLDTSRHFLDKETIVANLEAMAYNKMNVFHWHIVDDQSFPFESKVFPNLTKFGAYNARSHVYTHEDIADIIEQARIRGIRVIPEFDTPGHTFSWGFGQDYLLTPCYDYRREPNGMFGPINPILKQTYSFLRTLFKEVLSVFKDKYIHLGGDEVPLGCWESNPHIVNFMKRSNMTDIKELLSVYERELLNIVNDLGEDREASAGFIVWQELFDNGVKLKPDTIVQIWSGDSYSIDHVMRAGMRTLFSTCWYLDYINYGQDWDKYYRCEEIGSHLDEHRLYNESLLIGGEACLWTEYADDDSIMPRLWPRAAAAAERLWSDRHVVDVHKAAPRIEEQRCRMLRRGLHVGVLSGPGYCTRYRNQRKSSRSNIIDLPHLPRDVDQGQIVKERSSQFVAAIYTKDLSQTAVLFLVSCAVLVILYKLIHLRNHGGGSNKCSTVHHRRHKLAFIFLAIAIVWFIWMAPLWLHSWWNVNECQEVDSPSSVRWKFW